MPGNSNDQSLQHQIEQLQQELARLKTMLDHVGTYIFAKDLEGRYTYVNQLVCDLFGLKNDEILGKDDSHFFSFEESNDLRENDRRVMSEGIVIATEERNIVKETGETRYFQIVKSPLYNGQNQVCGMFGVATDVTERKQLELELKAKQELLDCIINNIDAYLYLKDNNNCFLYANPKTQDLLQQPLTSLIGKTGSEFLPEEIAETFVASDLQVLNTGEKSCQEVIYTLPDGSTRSFWSTKIPMKDASGEVTRIINLSTDITELVNLRSRLQEQLRSESRLRKEKEKMAFTDPLTGIYNRLKLNEALEYEVSRAQRYQLDLCVILIDIDLFKEVNDRHGHLVGDSVLVEFAKILQQNVRKPDIVGRWGGEEFIVICPETNLNGALTLAQNLKSCIEEHRFDIVKQKTASLGVAGFRNKDSVERLLSRADEALYLAKQKGRNRVEQQPH
jgi:diguanylate cyclase (GGDEF)-like protein/PAS domain S-box-containing protein